MARIRYSKKESWNRILRAINGTDVSSDPPETLTGEVLPEEEALSDIAQLLEGSVFGFLDSLDRYGEIWAWTGTATMTAIPATPQFTKITGTYQHYSDYLNVTPQPTQDRILVTDNGSVYEIKWGMSFIGSPNLIYTFEAYYGGIGIPQSAASETPNTSGTRASAYGSGYQYVSGTNVAIDLRVRPSAIGWLLPIESQLSIDRVGPRVNLGSNGS